MADIVIQAGHVFRTSGSTGTRSHDGDPTEQEFAWAVATAAADKLNARGHSARAIVADPQIHEYRGDVFVAIHCDGSSSSSAHGASTGYRTDEGADLAHRWKNAYAARGWVGFRSDNYTSALQGYYGCKRAIEQGNRRAVIVECGFLTNPADEAELASAAGQARVVDALVDAIEQTHPAPTPEDEPLKLDEEDREWFRDLATEIAGPRRPVDQFAQEGQRRDVWRWAGEIVTIVRDLKADELSAAIVAKLDGNADLAAIREVMRDELDNLTLTVDRD